MFYMGFLFIHVKDYLNDNVFTLTPDDNIIKCKTMYLNSRFYPTMWGVV